MRISQIENSLSLNTGVLSDNEFSNLSQNNLQVSLAVWATRNRCTHVCVTELLAILRQNGHSELPKDPRTLLKTPRNVTVAKKCGGEYVYIGIEKGIRLILKDFPQESYSSQMVDLLVNTDGVPLYISGFQMGEETVYVKIKVLTCDAPASQFMKGVKSRTGFYTCGRCIVRESMCNTG